MLPGIESRVSNNVRKYDKMSSMVWVTPSARIQAKGIRRGVVSCKHMGEEEMELYAQPHLRCGAAASAENLSAGS